MSNVEGSLKVVWNHPARRHWDLEREKRQFDRVSEGGDQIMRTLLQQYAQVDLIFIIPFFRRLSIGCKNSRGERTKNQGGVRREGQ